jgi:hypothetical protein
MKSKFLICSIIFLFGFTSLFAQNSTVVASDEARNIGDLLEIEMNGGKPFMDVLKEKHFSPGISDRVLEPHHFSSLFWAANGTPHRGEVHNRTAYAPMDMQYIKIYALMKEGVFFYDAEAHKLKKVEKSDYRVKMSDNDMVHRAPIVLLYVIDTESTGAVKEENKLNYAYLQAGSISQNVFLYCSSENLNSNIILDIKKDEFAKNLNIKAANILFVQVVGYRD